MIQPAPAISTVASRDASSVRSCCSRLHRGLSAHRRSAWPASWRHMPRSSWGWIEKSFAARASACVRSLFLLSGHAFGYTRPSKTCQVQIYKQCIQRIPPRLSRDSVTREASIQATAATALRCHSTDASNFPFPSVCTVLFRQSSDCCCWSQSLAGQSHLPTAPWGRSPGSTKED